MAPITPTHEYLSSLRSLAEPASALQKQGFITQPLSDEELLLKRRCSGCNKAMSQILRMQRPPADGLRKLGAVESTPLPSQILQHAFDEAKPDEPSTKGPPKEPPLRCQYHAGQVENRVWTCCRKAVPAPPCAGSLQHTPMPEPLHKLVENYQYYRTPIVLQLRNEVRSAVAVDCEMGTAASGDSELIRLTLVDYFSDEILIDNIVLPDVPMQHLNTRYSGVTWADMRNAQKRGTGLDGKAGAREAFWKYVGPNTILVGHGVQNDLRSLRLIHTLVVDSLVTESKRFKAKVAEEEARKAEMIAQGLITAEDLKAEKKSKEAGANGEEKVKKKKGGTMSLKTLAKKYLDRDIQVGKKGHDSLEDAVAARDIVHYNVLGLGSL